MISRNIFQALAAIARRQRLGQVLYAPLDVVLTPHDVVEPDLMYVSAGRSEILTHPNVQGAPDLVVEILSPSTRRQDELLKRDLYERGGVAEYWIVDPDAEAIKVLRRGEGALFGRPFLSTRRDGDVLKTPLLPGLDLPLAGVFADWGARRRPGGRRWRSRAGGCNSPERRGWTCCKRRPISSLGE